MVNVVANTLDRKPLNFVYRKRNDHEQAVQLGKLIQSLEKTIPGGLLVFFPSYECM